MENYNSRSTLDSCMGCFLAFMILGSTLWAQPTQDLRMMIKRGDSWQALPVDSLSIKVEGLGTQVRVTYDMRVFNPMAEILEGQCFLPLAAGEQVTGFALETDGEMREASVVEARLGRTAYEGVVRQQIDPGLLEMLSPNVYRLRVFPLPMQGTRRVRIVTESDLPPTNGMLQYVLHVPTNTPKLTFHLSWVGATGTPSVEGSPAIRFASKGEIVEASWSGSSQGWNTRPTLRIPFAPNEAKTWLDPSGWAYMAIPYDGQSKPFPRPDKVVMYWDVSASMSRWDKDKVIRAIIEWFKITRPDQLEVQPFHVLPMPGRTFSGKGNSAASELQTYLMSLAYDGAANWSAVPFQQAGVDQYLLVSDGQAIFHPKDVPPVNAPVYVITGAAAAEAGPLLGFARHSKGRTISNTESEAEISAALRTQLPHILSIEGEETYQWLPLNATAGQGLLQVVGKMDSGQRRPIVMTVGFPDDHRKITVPVAKTSAASLPLDVERMWARAAVSRELLLPQPDEARIATLGKEFHLVTPLTSLLVLERLEDYVTYRVLPPEDMRAAYEEKIAALDKTWNLELMSYRDQTAASFQARIAWWETEFKPTPPPVKKTSDDRRGGRSSRSENLPTSAAPPGDDESFGSPDADADGVIDMIDSETASYTVQSLAGDRNAAFDSEEENNDSPGHVAVEDSITLLPWVSDNTYIPMLKSAGESWYSFYLNYRAENSTSAGFYLDVANWRWQQGDTLGAIRIVSNLAEINPGDHELLRSLARRLQQAGASTLALELFQQVLRLRPEEPQSLRDLAWAHVDLDQWQTAVDLLYEVVTTQWESRFPEISVMAAHELNSLLGRAPTRPSVSDMDPRFVADLPTDLRIVLQWDQNDIDMDLWVTDPRGERCLYSHRETGIGGWMSRDFTGGYGPEEFLLKKAIPGTYKVEVNYYGSRRQEMSRPVLVQVQLILDYGLPTQSEQSITRQLGNTSGTIEIGEMEIQRR